MYTEMTAFLWRDAQGSLCLTQIYTHSWSLFKREFFFYFYIFNLCALVFYLHVFGPYECNAHGGHKRESYLLTGIIVGGHPVGAGIQPWALQKSSQSF